MHLRINNVSLASARVDELRDVVAGRALSLVIARDGCCGVFCTAERATGACAIVSAWDSVLSLRASEAAIDVVFRDAIEGLDAHLNDVVIAEVVSEINLRPVQVGSQTRVVQLASPAGQAETMVDFYESNVVPRLACQPGFQRSRLVRDIEHDGRFAAMSQWADRRARGATATSWNKLRGQLARSVAQTAIGPVVTSEIILIEPRAGPGGGV